MPLSCYQPRISGSFRPRSPKFNSLAHVPLECSAVVFWGGKLAEFAVTRDEPQGRCHDADADRRVPGFQASQCRHGDAKPLRPNAQ